ncbi:hypothetical protein [Nesterenkonia pannonica]|uniref:hypothetical protein n=1 Tax=Nesterenkonia pannonica TaxID=1548602 RepID=UPI0021643E50|nr:hypothetical protein [Nesterenkonia pannonica]
MIRPGSLRGNSMLTWFTPAAAAAGVAVGFGLAVLVGTANTGFESVEYSWSCGSSSLRPRSWRSATECSVEGWAGARQSTACGAS